MRKIPLEQITAGIKFSEPVYIDEKNMLVPAKIPVKQKDLDQLRRWGVMAVMTDGEILRESPKEAEPKVSPTAVLKLNAVGNEKYRLYTEMIDKLNGVFIKVKTNEDVQTKTIDSIVASLLGGVRDAQNEMIGYILGGEISDTPLAKSSVNSAILAVVIGTYLKMPNHKLMQLATGALLHDVGMLRVPDQILQKQGQLSDEESQKIKAHPLFSYKIICKEFMYPDDVGIIALQHHERWDGEGYPRRTSGSDIDSGARIVSVSDAFEAMVSEKPYRNSMIGFAAMKNLLSDNMRRFDPEILKSFIKSMGIYPIGSVVILSNASVARVIDVHADAPLRPKVRILIDEYGKQFGDDAGDVIDLLSDKALFIARAIDPKQFASA